MENLKLFRRRFIPDELVYLRDDEIVSVTEDKIVTRWQSIKPRQDFAYGESTYYRKKGIKVSRIMDKDRNFLYWYVDIVRERGPEALKVADNVRLNSKAVEYFEKGRSDCDEIVVYEDLLLDVVVEPSGLIAVLDMDEVADAYEKGLITLDMLKTSMETCNNYARTLYERHGKVPYDSFEFVKAEL